MQQPTTSEFALGLRRCFTVALGVLAAVAIIASAACSSKTDQTTPTPEPTVTPAATSTSTPSSDRAVQAVKDIVKKANDEQQQALSQHDPALMRDTATADYYALLVQTQQNLEAAGVTAIELVSLEWGPVSVQGTSAQAATTETWKVMFADGGSQQSSDRNVYTLVEQGGNWLIESDAHIGSNLGQPGTALSQSRNWAGYAASGGPFTSVSGTWIVPHVDGNSSAGAADATWVGIGGVDSYDLIQAGTQATVNDSGKVTYAAWVETLPQASQEVDLSVQPGDVIAVTISQQTMGNWQVTINNRTTNKQYRTSVQYTSSLSSAEWIEEAPSTVSARAHIVTLDQFGTVEFSNATATLGGQTATIAAAGGLAITMSDQTGTIASPSALGPDGASFTVTRTGGTQE